MPMYFLRYAITPAESHPEFGVLGEGLVNCWVNRPTLATADRVARADVAARGWAVLEREAAEEVTAADYDEEDEWRGYYEQALTDREVYAYHTSPRYPVYHVVAAVERAAPPEAAEAHYFVCGEWLTDGDESVAVPDFWDESRRQTVLDAAGAAIRVAGWVVTGVVSHDPCGRSDLPEDMQFYYDEAEESGACLVFVRDGEAEE